ncbi:NAD(P)/FAD-dependent oxidoreductase [Flavobacterium psychrophilum]|jgi:thioredoxin reductase (NADPH)|uniref:Ferredoxin--NADP reductase n=2 Tax=Flavobacterium psychrophilum TaxID=96345 RepID=FENR_FLAPJ|nr:NAD(P)/FAD-dependent oxidoreductase [Flavobacterium psychrophilum]A6H064.1 RecName: Full=Ferredoxin--NADP reductase; Short=FNR; Short=Fd-NADP(+) reductase [Flavobacterium psychrophilum JIP02/86]AIG30426.1 ferredoxin-NADP reductase [Flavobacterium psychrophilum]AIG32701.1 ferredoxin-NADP reductase [Flavobacterium psychrophilum]AIG34856.1 ferredoxin-NADP reductase [Flavobacterium psychrophilum]AIG37221.1 ferredoxin-NADP reductase [Flavobacterium psychrophilum]AIG39485.1 ferredoxin-NADP reduc
MIETDILIIGAGPTGLFTVFEAGLLKLKCHIIDGLPQPGGQLTELYPKKPIFDIPGYPSVLAGDLITNLIEQIKQFQPGFTLNETAETIEKLEDGTFIVTSNKGTKHHANSIAIAGGLGSFEPRKPILKDIEFYENDKGVEYFVKDPEKFRDKKVVISGGGDSALDWSIYLSNIASEVTLVHRRNEFRGALDSVEKVQELKSAGKIKLITPGEVVGFKGSEKIESVDIQVNTTLTTVPCDYFIPLFGLTPKLGAIANWGLEIEKNAIKVNNALDYQTNIEGIYAIGDVNTYPGKLKLILCGFHEATLMVQSVYQRINPGKKYVLKYTTVSGIDGFDGTRKEAEKQVVKSIE